MRGTSTQQRIFELDTRSIGLFRIALGLVLLADQFIRMTDWHAFHGPDSIMSEEHGHRLEGVWVWSVYWITEHRALPDAVEVVRFIVEIALVAGIRSRLAALILFVIVASVNNYNPLLLHGGDRLLGGMVFFAALLPLGGRYALESLRDGRHTAQGYRSVTSAAYPVREELFQELTRTLEILRSKHPDEPLAHIPVAQLRGAIHDYLGCRKHETKRGRFKSVVACQSIRWTALPRIDIDGLKTRMDGGSLGTIRARLERPLEVGEEVDQVKLVRRQLGGNRTGPSRFELHITVSHRLPKPKYVKPPAMVETQREVRQHQMREARKETRWLANEQRRREAKRKVEREATTRGRICGIDLGARHTGVDDADRRLTPRKRDRHLRKAEARAVTCTECGARTPRDAARGANLAMKWIVRVESTRVTGLSRSRAPGENPCPRSRNWTVHARSLLRRGSSAERLRGASGTAMDRSVGQPTPGGALVERALASWGEESPRKDRKSDHVPRDRN